VSTIDARLAGTTLTHTCGADEDAFGLVLREFFLDLAQFRQSDNSALFAQTNPSRESEEEREKAARQRIPSLAGSKVSTPTRV
jgi:hypothetical protein